MYDISSRVVERTDARGPRRWPAAAAVLAAVVAAALGGFAAGSARDDGRREADALRERAQRAERLVIALKGERDRLNGQITDDHVIIDGLERRVAERLAR
jgi:hypothetical protein